MASQNQPPLPQPELVTSSVSSRPKEQRTLQTSRSNRVKIFYFFKKLLKLDFFFLKSLWFLSLMT